MSTKIPIQKSSLAVLNKQEETFARVISLHVLFFLNNMLLKKKKSVKTVS
jgi:hypothetical protein